MNIKLFQSLLLVALVKSSIIFAHETTPEIENKIKNLQIDMRQNLREGNVDTARNILEKAAGNFHAEEIELGLIQTLMQAGEYRHALSAAAHTQAEHTDVIDTSVFYAWLLALGGQTNPALNLIENTLAKFPDNANLLVLKKQINDKNLIASNIMTSDDIQLMPYTSNAISKKKPSHFLASGVVINDGKNVISSLNIEQRQKNIYIRNGLGKEIRATLKSNIAGTDLVVLTLESASKTSTGVTTKIPFPGSPIYIVGYSPSTTKSAEWPQLKIDILGTPTSTDNLYPIHVKNTSTGSAVFNQQGKLIGIINGNNKVMTDGLTNVSQNHKEINEAITMKSPMDEIYEAALGTVVQVMTNF